MASTTNFGWETPDDSDLVKDGAAAMRTLGNSIDTSFVDLKGGTSGQILAKASNTDLDYTWITNDIGDITAVTAGTGLTGGGTSGAVSLAIDSTVTTLTGTQTLTNKTLTSPVLTTPSISNIDAKGDLLAGTADNTIGRLAVGTNGQVLTADSTASTGLAWATAASGGMTLLSTTTLSGSVTTVSSIDQTYTNLFVVVSGYTSASFASVAIRYNGVTSGYYGVAMAESSTANTRHVNTGTIDTAVAGSPKGSDTNGLLTFTIANYAATGFHHVPWETVYLDNDTSIIRVVRGIGANSNTSAVSSISIGMGPSLTGGTIKIYGVK